MCFIVIPSITMVSFVALISLGYQTIIPTLSELFCTSNLSACTVVYVHVRDEGDQHMFKKDILEGRFKPYSEDTLRG